MDDVFLYSMNLYLPYKYPAYAFNQQLFICQNNKNSNAELTLNDK